VEAGSDLDEFKTDVGPAFLRGQAGQAEKESADSGCISPEMAKLRR
jgi:hypothetical protein